MKTKTQYKQIAKKILIESIGTAYYKISDNNDIPENEKQIIIDYINKFGETMAKSINERYITY